MLVNTGVLVAAIVLALIGVYSFVAGWNLDVDEADALVAATRQVGFPVGHASAQMGWRGLLSRPTWRILLYSADDPPEKRGLVLVDGVDGSIVEWFVEDNPEDWSVTRSLALSGRRGSFRERRLRHTGVRASSRPVVFRRQFSRDFCALGSGVPTESGAF